MADSVTSHRLSTMYMILSSVTNFHISSFHLNMHRLKALLQLMAASEVKRDVVYFTFGDVQLKRDLCSLYSILVDHQVTVGQVLYTLPITVLHKLMHTLTVTHTCTAVEVHTPIS